MNRSTGFHCLLLASKLMFLQAYGVRGSAIVLLSLSPREILTDKPIQNKLYCGLPAHSLRSKKYATTCIAVDLTSQTYSWMIKLIFDLASFGT